MLYIIDFDDTIFDTRLFKDLLFNINGSENKFFLENKYEEIKARSGVFNLIAWSQECDVSQEQIIKLGPQLSKFIYDDFYDFSKKVGKQNIIILSYGDTKLQVFKIINAGISEHISDYIITSDQTKKSDILRIYEKYQDIITLIDNNIYITKNDFNFPINIIKIDRIGRKGDIAGLNEILN